MKLLGCSLNALTDLDGMEQRTRDCYGQTEAFEDWVVEGERAVGGHRAPEAPHNPETQRPESGTGLPAPFQSQSQNTEAPAWVQGSEQGLEQDSQASQEGQRQDGPDRGWGWPPPLSPLQPLGQEAPLFLLEPLQLLLSHVCLRFCPFQGNPAALPHTRLYLKNLLCAQCHQFFPALALLWSQQTLLVSAQPPVSLVD